MALKIKQEYSLELFQEEKRGSSLNEFFIQERDEKGKAVKTDYGTDWRPFRGGLWFTARSPKVVRGIAIERKRPLLHEIYREAGHEFEPEQEEFSDSTAITGKLEIKSNYWLKLSMLGRKIPIFDIHLRISGSDDDAESAYVYATSGIDDLDYGSTDSLNIGLTLKRDRFDSLVNQIATSARPFRLDVGLLQMGGLFTTDRYASSASGVIKILTPEMAKSIETPDDFDLDISAGVHVQPQKFNLQLILNDSPESNERPRTIKQMKEDESLSPWPEERYYQKPIFWWIVIPALFILFPFIEAAVSYFL